MLETHLADSTKLRCEALLDRVAATPVGHNPDALTSMLAECDALEHAIENPFLICKLRDVRHWLRLAYDHTLHAYPNDALRNNLLDAIAGFRSAVREGRRAAD